MTKSISIITILFILFTSCSKSGPSSPSTPSSITAEEKKLLGKWTLIKQIDSNNYEKGGISFPGYPKTDQYIYNHSYEFKETRNYLMSQQNQDYYKDLFRIIEGAGQEISWYIKDDFLFIGQGKFKILEVTGSSLIIRYIGSDIIYDSTRNYVCNTYYYKK